MKLIEAQAMLRPFTTLYYKSVERSTFTRFLVVGFISWVIDFGMLNLLQHTLLIPEPPQQTLKVLVASATAFCVALSVNFTLNRYWTFTSGRQGQLRRQLVSFAIITAVGLSFRILFVGVTFRLFGETAASVLERLAILSEPEAITVNQIGTNLAQGTAIIIVLFWNFFANRRWTYT